MPACPPIDVIAEALGNLLSQFDDSPNLQALVRVLVTPFQDVEDDACALIVDATIENATGELLDRYGALLSFPRNGRSDDDYRRVLRVIVASYQSSGTIESIITTVEILAGVEGQETLAGSGVRLDILPPAAYQLLIYSTSPLSAQEVQDVADALEDLTAAGVGYEVYETGSANPFTFDSGPGFDLGEFGRSLF